MRIAVGHPFVGRGGSEARIMWLIETVRGSHRVDVVSTGGWDLDELNQAYGTTIRPDEVGVRIAPLGRLLGDIPASAWRAGIYQRFCRSIASEYDVRISAYNCTDWGAPAIHFMADFCWSRTIRERFDLPTPGRFYRDSPLRRAYLSVGRLFARPSGRNPLRDDTIIANSRWTAGLLEPMCGKRPRVIYPPVPGKFPAIPWENKEPDFFCIGRIEPEKRIEDAISILARIRARGFPVRLHVIGRFADTPYARGLRSLCEQNAGWVVLEGPVYGPAKLELLSRFRYGIHTCRREAFGITVAEMIKAGAIAFAPAEGGQAEILADEALIFRDVDEAVVRIEAILQSSERQAEVRACLADRAGLFSAERFVAEVRMLLEESAA